MKYIFIGPPGSGKGTQAHLLAKRLRIPHISVGQLLRDEVKKQSVFGKEIQSRLAHGNIVRQKIVNDIVRKKLAGMKHYILDGYPRTVFQARYLTRMADIDAVIDIELSQKEAVQRIIGRYRADCAAYLKKYHVNPKDPRAVKACGRADDNPKTAAHRFGVYRAQSMPVIDYYEKRGKLVRIDGRGSISRVHRAITNALSH